MGIKKNARLEPAPPTPPGADGVGCEIQFGHNAKMRLVLMRFNIACAQLIFTPEQADDVASKLTEFAEKARAIRKNP